MEREEYYVTTSYEVDSSLYIRITVTKADTKEVVEQTQLYLGDSNSVEEMIEETDEKILRLKEEYNGNDEEFTTKMHLMFIGAIVVLTAILTNIFT